MDFHRVLFLRHNLMCHPLRISFPLPPACPRPSTCPYHMKTASKPTFTTFSETPPSIKFIVSLRLVHLRTIIEDVGRPLPVQFWFTAFYQSMTRIISHVMLHIQGYMEENILPNGWLGIWRSGGVFGSAPLGECTASILVEIENVVINADEEKLEALATVSLPGKKDGTSNDEREFRGVVVNHPGQT